MLIPWTSRAEEVLNSNTQTIGAVIVICGFVWRLLYASDFYLNPDEALHFTVASHQWHGLEGFYQNATSVAHPPLFIPVLRGMLHLGRSEWILRLVPIAAGALFPWFVMLWLLRFAGHAAALWAQLLLTFSPTLIDLSTEVRAYTLAFLFLSISLVLLEEALAHNSVSHMAGFHAFLYLAILTEYSVAWFAAALGIYAILRLCIHSVVPVVRTTWLLGQAGALALYIFLYATHISRTSYAVFQGMYSTWLQGAFPQPHEHLIVFVLRGTFRQFKYALDGAWLGGIGLIAFVFGLYALFRIGSYWHSILLVLPFSIACLAAILHLFPYGATRHTAILGLSIAAGVGVAIASVFHHRILPIALALPLILIWNYLASDSYLPVAHDRRHVSAIQAATMFLHDQIPAQSIILTDAGTSLLLGYYLRCPDYSYSDSTEPYRTRQCGNFRMVIAPVFQFTGLPDLDEALFQTNQKYHPDIPIWVAAGGFRIEVANSVSSARPFGKAIAIFPVSQ